MLYRLRNRLNYARFRQATRSIDDGPPVACDPAASCEVHTMLGSRDLHMYLIAITSLLRWCPAVRVAVHSDGSLGAAEIRRLERRVPGVRVIDAAEADRRAEERLARYPALRTWRRVDTAYRRLLDTELWATTPKRIIMDADVLVVKQPRALVEWLDAGTSPFLLGQAPTEEADRRARASRHMQAEFRRHLNAIAAACGRQPIFLQGATAGFYGCTNELDLEAIASCLSACDSLHIRMRDWGADQCLVIFLLASAGADLLDPEHCFNFEPECAARCADAHVIHFYGTYRFSRGIYPQLAARLCRERAQSGAVRHA
jgi:hypothetical protein